MGEELRLPDLLEKNHSCCCLSSVSNRNFAIRIVPNSWYLM
jgi:hypothetical protein